MLNHWGWTWQNIPSNKTDDRDFHIFWQAGKEDPTKWSRSERKARAIPRYVLEHAPYVHLFSGEQYWPSDVAEHLIHTTPYVNYTELNEKVDLANLSKLNDAEGAMHGRAAYLHSDDNIEDLPEWLSSAYNIPFTNINTDPILRVSNDGTCGGSSGMTCSGSKFGSCCSIFGHCGSGNDYCSNHCDPSAGTCYGPVRHGTHGPQLDLRKRGHPSKQSSKQKFGYTDAPAILIVIPKEDGIVDAFWFFFYSYNLGKIVLNIRFGNHVGDWEHTLVRFKDGKPQQIFLSEHSWGEAYDWHVIEKYLPNDDGTMLSTRTNSSIHAHAKRPVVFSAEGSHAMYGTAGFHPYVAPFGILHDDTDRGPLWDPAANVKSYTYDLEHKKLRSSTDNPKAPTEWFDFNGHWGDKNYLLSDPRQYRFAGEYHYLAGPLGPKFKDLDRNEVCQGKRRCEIKQFLGGSRRERDLVHADGVEDDVDDEEIESDVDELSS